MYEHIEEWKLKPDFTTPSIFIFMNVIKDKAQVPAIFLINPAAKTLA